MGENVNHAPDYQTQASAAAVKNCPNCGNPTVSVGIEKVGVEASPLLLSTVVGLLLITAYKLIVKMQHSPSGSESLETFRMVGLIVVAAIVVIAALIWALYNLRARPCHVAHCSQCGYAEALDESPKWTKGWKLKGLPGTYVGGVWVNAPGKLTNSQQPEGDDSPSNPFRPV